MGIHAKGNGIWPCAYVRGYLYKGFTVHGALKAAYVYYECDNAFDLFINKRAVGVSDAESSITDLVQEGYNTVHIRVYPDQSPGTVHFGQSAEKYICYIRIKGKKCYIRIIPGKRSVSEIFTNRMSLKTG